MHNKGFLACVLSGCHSVCFSVVFPAVLLLVSFVSWVRGCSAVLEALSLVWGMVVGGGGWYGTLWTGNSAAR